MDAEPRVTTYEIGGGQSERIERTYSVAKSAERRVSENPPSVDLVAQQGRKAWSLLHSYRGCDPQWVELWEHFIPQAGGCGCKDNYKAILKDYPPDYTDADSFFRWGWFLHNLVNEKLGNPLIELDEARRIWNRHQPTE